MQREILDVPIEDGQFDSLTHWRKLEKEKKQLTSRFNTKTWSIFHLFHDYFSLWLGGSVTGSTLGLRFSRWSECTAEDAQAEHVRVYSASQRDAFACDCKGCVCFGNLSAGEASLQERIHQVLLAPLSSKHVFYRLHKCIVHWGKT